MSFQPPSLDDFSEANESGERLRRQQFLQIPGYKIHHKIGSGGMATVYRASQRSLDRDVAIKVLKWEFDDDDQLVQRFKKEGRILAQLLHTNIVTIYDVGISEDKKLFISIEYLTGGTLADRINLGLSFDSAIQIARAIANALGYAHERGIVHRDIKPSNIMFRHDGTPVLTDFGVARVLESKTAYTMEGLTVGSPGYMSPEQAMGESATIQSDLYSLGVVIYEMLAGQRLYQAENPISVAMKHVNDPIPKLPKQYAYLQSVLNKLLAKKSADRYRNTHEFLEALDAIVPSDTGTQPKTPRDFENLGFLEFTTGKFRSLFKNQRIRWPMVVVIISIIILLIAIFYVVSRKFVDQSEIAESAIPVDSTEQARRNQQIATLLKLADAQRKIGLLAGDSKEDNAEATYRQILIFDPENAQALAGLEAIADEYARRARRQLSANALPESLQRIELGLAASSQHRELLRLRQNVEGQMTAIRLQKAQEEERRRSQLQAEQFLEQARSSFQEGLLELSLVHIEQGLLAVPEQPDLLALREQVRARLAEQQRQAEAERRQREEEARRQAAEAERYQAAEAERQQAEAEQRQREEEARRQAAEAGRQKTEQARQQVEVAKRGQEADQYLARAVELRRQGDQAASMQTIEKGLALVPDHKELKRLRQEVSAEIAAQQRQRAEREQREREIASLLEQADMHVKAWRLTTPTGNNAQETYQQVLKLDASNAQARAGLERIAEGYLQLAQKRRAAGALQDSLTFIEKGLEVISNHADLLRLREEVRVEESAVQQRQEQQRREQQRLEQRRQEQQQQEQERQEQQRQLEQQQRQEQRRLDRQRRWEQQQEGQRLLEQRRLEQQRQEQLRKLEQQRKEPPRQEPPRKEPPPEPKSQPPSESARPRVFGTF